MTHSGTRCQQRFAASSEEYSSRRRGVGEEVGSYPCGFMGPVRVGGVHVGGVRFGNVRVDIGVGVPLRLLVRYGVTPP